VNVFNELTGEIPPVDRESLKRAAEREARFLAALAPPGAGILITEPGTPQPAAFITELRTALLRDGAAVYSPCPHHGECPFPGGYLAPLRVATTHSVAMARSSTTARRGATVQRTSDTRDSRNNRGAASPKTGEKQKWCHFAFDTEDAPQKLRRLSAAAGLPKERATLSFLYASSGAPGNAGDNDHITALRDSRNGADRAEPPRLSVRILSDAFRVGGGYGRYGCSAAGTVLVTGSGPRMDALPAGTLLSLPPPEPERRDPKSGALILSAG
jgi:hypothetical protein